MSEATALVRLQELDLDLMKLKRELASLPQKEKLEHIKGAKKKLAQQLTKLVGKKKDIDMDLEDKDASRKNFERLVDETQDKVQEAEGNYRHVQDLEKQLSTLAKKLEKVDFETKGLLDELEKVEGSLAQAQQMSERLIQEEEQTTEQYKQEIARIKSMADALTHDRKNLVNDLSAEVLARYDAACKRFSGLAVETLTANKPSICRVALQPSSMADLKKTQGEIGECPYCRRMLVFSRTALDETV
ncbi:MAG: hypothetical protein IJ125_02860 [Atopobiaceae bacterium]|nr:hypothetical protein [Atopobiaceae bacterium]